MWSYLIKGINQIGAIFDPNSLLTDAIDLLTITYYAEEENLSDFKDFQHFIKNTIFLIRVVHFFHFDQHLVQLSYL